MVDLRTAQPEDLRAATALCLRSKAHWGYDAAFMAACADELTLTADDLAQSSVVLAFSGDALAGVAQVARDSEGCFLEKLFVDPPFMGLGIGRRLFHWAKLAAADLGAREMIVEADPGAVAFYEAMGCVAAGTAPSGSITGRHLPRLIYGLDHRPRG